MKIKEFEQALRKEDFSIGDSFWIDGWEFEVVNRKNRQVPVFDDDDFFKWELMKEDFIQVIKDRYPEIKDINKFFERHKDEIIYYFGKGFDALLYECGINYRSVMHDALEKVIQQNCKAAGGRQDEI
jgi:hypothetical protein